MKKPISLHANGKLLITGEYLVLKGAKALALPVRFGQQLIITKTEDQVIEWESSSPAGLWFRAKYDLKSLEILENNHNGIAHELKSLLSAARKLNSSFLKESTGYRAQIFADYPLEWGLGSSSTLIYLVAGWAGVDSFNLYKLVSKGSGYDVSCAGQSGLLYYRLKDGRPDISLTKPGKALTQNTMFVYLGKKQDTKSEVDAFLKQTGYSQKDIDQISRLASFICMADSATELILLVREHESILSSILKRPSIALNFPDFPGTVKSLGAWGGDFAMFVSEESHKSVIEYLHKKGFNFIFSYAEMEVKK